MKKVKIVMEFNSTEEFLKSEQWNDLKEDIDSGELKEEFEEEEGVTDVKVNISIS